MYMFRIILLRSISVDIQPHNNIPFMKAKDFEFAFDFYILKRN